MIFWLSVVTIFILSVWLAIRASAKELSVPEHIRKIKIRQKKGLSGVILFLKKQIVHYSSDSS